MKKLREPRPGANPREPEEITPDRLAYGLSLLDKRRGLSEKLGDDNFAGTENLEALRHEAETRGLEREIQIELIERIQRPPRSRGRPRKPVRLHDRIRIGYWTLTLDNFSDGEAVKVLTIKFKLDAETVRSHVTRSKQLRKSRRKPRA